MSFQKLLVFSVFILCLLSVTLILRHEQALTTSSSTYTSTKSQLLEASQSVLSRLTHEFSPVVPSTSISTGDGAAHHGPAVNGLAGVHAPHTSNAEPTKEVVKQGKPLVKIPLVEDHPANLLVSGDHAENKHIAEEQGQEQGQWAEEGERKGLLQCDGQYIDSEIIYWKIVPGDNTYESPITPHHDIHHDRYLTYEYDEGGWNNIRMSLECVLVFTHAMGRTLVSPPRQNLYLLDKKHKTKDGKVRSGMGFEDFFDMDLLKSHKGYHVITSEEFLAKEGVTGGLHGKLPPKNSTKIGGRDLNRYYRAVADKLPAWTGKFLAMPDANMDMKQFDLSKIDQLPEDVRARMKRFGGERTPVFYGEDLQNAHHIHFMNGPSTRLLQHHYAFNFFVDKEMQSFYRRFVRDYLRYKDEIQCSGHEIVKLVRADARAHNLKMNNPGRNGSSTPDDTFYALHVRRGDFQYKDVKISAQQIVKNLIVDGLSVIPRGALVYISTDDPKGICDGCRVQGIPCTKYAADGQYPQGCPKDATWDAFKKAGWTVRFLHDYTNQGAIAGVNPNTVGMVEVIVCSRAEVFAGTYYSSFTGYIHRLRGYHGIGEQSYYHSTNRVTKMRMKKSVGHGFSREWRAGWTDDQGGLI